MHEHPSVLSIAIVHAFLAVQTFFNFVPRCVNNGTSTMNFGDDS